MGTKQKDSKTNYQRLPAKSDLFPQGSDVLGSRAAAAAKERDACFKQLGCARRQGCGRERVGPAPVDFRWRAGIGTCQEWQGGRLAITPHDFEDIVEANVAAAVYAESCDAMVSRPLGKPFGRVAAPGDEAGRAFQIG